MSKCPLDDRTISKKECRGCDYFEYDESDGGDEGRVITYFCSYKKVEIN